MSYRYLLPLLFSLLFAAPAGAIVSPTPPAEPAVPTTAAELREQMRAHRQMERETLTKRERRLKRKAARKEMRQTLRDYRRGDVEAETVLYAIVALLLPPLAVYLVEGEATGNLYLNLLLTLGGIVLTILLGSFLWFLPAIVHALLVVFSGV